MYTRTNTRTSYWAVIVIWSLVVLRTHDLHRSWPVYAGKAWTKDLLSSLQSRGLIVVYVFLAFTSSVKQGFNYLILIAALYCLTERQANANRTVLH